MRNLGETKLLGGWKWNESNRGYSSDVVGKAGKWARLG